MKKIACILLALVLCLGGCGARGEGLIGRWDTRFDMAGALRGNMTADAWDKLALGRVEMTLRYTFLDDGTYTLAVDERSAQQAYETIQGAIRAMLTANFEELLRQSGSTLTVDEYLAGIGSSLDAQVDAAFGDEIINTLVENMAVAGQYRLDDGVLYCSFDTETPAEDGVAYGAALTEDTLTLSLAEDASGVYPLTFTRA